MRARSLEAALLLLVAPSSPRRLGQAPTCPGAVNQQLGAFIGEWRVHASFRVSQSAWDSSEARASVVPELSGCLLRETFRGTRFHKPYAVLALWGAEGDSVHPIQRTFAHSQHGYVSLAVGGWTGTGDTLVLGDSVFVRGSWVFERELFTHPTLDGFVNEGWRSEDGGRTWFLTRRAVYVPERVRRR